MFVLFCCVSSGVGPELSTRKLRWVKDIYMIQTSPRSLFVRRVSLAVVSGQNKFVLPLMPSSIGGGVSEDFRGRYREPRIQSPDDDVVYFRTITYQSCCVIHITE